MEKGDNTLEELKNELTEAIKDSEEYKEYIRLGTIISRNPDLRRTVDEFRKRTFEVVNNEDIEDVYSAMLNLNVEYADMRRQDIVNRYLTAEICFCSLVKDVIKTIADSIDMELDFLK